MDGILDINTSISLLNKIIEHADRENLPLILGTDCNSHHVCWGDLKTDTRGDQLLTNLVSHNINWVNSGTAPTFTNSRGHCSIIDLTLVNTPGMDLVADWKVSDRISNSDHKYITFNITGVTTPSRPVRRNPNNTNWEEFHGRLEADTNIKKITESHISDVGDLDQKTEELLSAIRNAYHQCCPVTHVTGRNKKPPWLTKSVQNARKDVRSKLMKARRLKTNQSQDEYRYSSQGIQKRDQGFQTEVMENVLWRAPAQYLKMREYIRFLNPRGNQHEPLDRYIKTANPKHSLSRLQKR